MDRGERMFMPVETEMSTGAIRTVIGPSGTTAIGILLSDRSNEIQSEKAC